MKSQHRHELAENDLSKLLGRWMEKFDEHANTILVGMVVVALFAAGLIYWTRTNENQLASGWTELAAATSAEDFANVADAFAGSPVAPWARLRAANGFLHEGIRLSLSDRPASNDRLEQARAAFESLIAPGQPPPVREQALLGLAVTTESLSDGDTEPAIAAYQQLLSEFPESRFREFANARIESLKTGSAQEFYAWFRQQNPKPADLPVPKDRATSTDSSLDSLFKDLDGSGKAAPPVSGGNPFDSSPINVPLSSGTGGSKSTGDGAGSSTAEAQSTESGAATDAPAGGSEPTAEDNASGSQPADDTSAAAEDHPAPPKSGE